MGKAMNSSMQKAMNRHRRTGKSMVLYMIVAISTVLVEPVHSRGASEAIRDVERIMRGSKNVYYQMEMTVHRPRWNREMSVEAWDSRAREASFIRITSPPRDAGTAFLKKGNTFRQYIPRIKRTIRISESMMLQSWMGSDFSNDDLARESSMTEDYRAQKAGQQKCADHTCDRFVLTAKPDAPVVWAQLEVLTRSPAHIPVSITYYNESHEALKRMEFADVRNVQGKPFPHKWVMHNLKKEGHKTTLEFRRVIFDGDMPSSIFTERNLRRGN